MPLSPAVVPKPRRPRPSRARGLRTTTGCITCRKRRVKCDESKPRCGPCSKSNRECTYQLNGSSSGDNPAQGNSENAVGSTSPSNNGVSAAGDIDPQLFTTSPELRFDLSPLTIETSLPSPNSAPFEWYDLLAEDAINNIQKHNLGFEQISLSRRQSPVPDDDPAIDPNLESPSQSRIVEPPLEPWNCAEIIHLSDDELELFQHFITFVGPILDLFDPTRHFATIVPRLAMHNVGLLKSTLAVAARHKALLFESSQSQSSTLNVQTPGSIASIIDEASAQQNALSQAATQYYYETLHYLSQNLLYPSYNRSVEIIGTAILISTYEMFDANGSHRNGDWERHLRGIFWIQRSQDNNGESTDGLRRAAWWAWLRQDIWVAFRENRRTLTIWRPTRRLADLTPDELATRILYITARCVDFAANERNYDMARRIEQGDKLLQALEDWYRILPRSFHPIYKLPCVQENGPFAPIWIHPPSHAGAIQSFHFARIIVLINQPSEGGMSSFRQRQRLLDESVATICGIAMMHQGKDLPSAFVNFQAVYAAGLCVQTPAKQSAILHLLEGTLHVSKFPPTTLLNDLANYWREEL
ncbi:hypothetical protein BCR34DRAFT_625021 [Clohesyomyces aquaticus]|uniref:Zn(2)-C6 fungal-type domain-containing protein n=1 Tax=Clohesyomyces aquaticus TaxID=1231657 RepID=A0A1Y1ZL19_9PLEO|nr:hypothetical protein BCR34DRAFT_625021 [Clohesyomyces aquaticus]